ncbi:hypothetical protein COOONC_25921 [Cooperia oncophora]
MAETCSNKRASVAIDPVKVELRPKPRPHPNETDGRTTTSVPISLLQVRSSITDKFPLARIQAMKKISVIFRNPLTLVTGNETHLTFSQFTLYCRSREVAHDTTSLHPQSNGQAERFVAPSSEDAN